MNTTVGTNERVHKGTPLMRIRQRRYPCEERCSNGVTIETHPNDYEFSESVPR